MKKKIIMSLFLAAVLTVPFFVVGCSTPEEESSESVTTSESADYEGNLGDDIFD